MKLCSPEAQSLPLSVGASARPVSLQGVRVGLLDNAKAPVDKMMAHIDRRLKERFPGIETMLASKVAASTPATTQMMQNLRQNCDVVINALGD